MVGLKTSKYSKLRITDIWYKSMCIYLITFHTKKIVVLQYIWKISIYFVECSQLGLAQFLSMFREQKTASLAFVCPSMYQRNPPR